MHNAYQLDIITPDVSLFSGQCEALTVTLCDGEATVLKDHSPMLAMIPAGNVKVKCDGKWRVLSLEAGFLKVTAEGAELFSQGGKWADE